MALPREQTDTILEALQYHHFLKETEVIQAQGLIQRGTTLLDALTGEGREFISRDTLVTVTAWVSQITDIEAKERLGIEVRA